MENRIAELELRINVAEDTIEALNQAAFRQQRQLDALQEQLRELYRQMQGLAAAGRSPGPADELPPHY